MINMIFLKAFFYFFSCFLTYQKQGNLRLVSLCEGHILTHKLGWHHPEKPPAKPGLDCPKHGDALRTQETAPEGPHGSCLQRPLFATVVQGGSETHPHSSEDMGSEASTSSK